MLRGRGYIPILSFSHFISVLYYAVQYKGSQRFLIFAKLLKEKCNQMHLISCNKTTSTVTRPIPIITIDSDWASHSVFRLLIHWLSDFLRQRISYVKHGIGFVTSSLGFDTNIHGRSERLRNLPQATTSYYKYTNVLDYHVPFWFRPWLLVVTCRVTWFLV